MTDCTQVPTLDEIYQAKKNITDLDTFTNSTADTFVDSDGVNRKTMEGIENEADIVINNIQSEGDTAIADFINESNSTLAEKSDEFDQTIDRYRESRGFNTKGTFAHGFTYDMSNDVGLDANGNPWILIDTSSLPVAVTAGTTPTNPPYKQVAYGTAAQVSTNTNDTVQSFIDSFALKILQSPTDGGLTEIQTRTVETGEVYEVRKTSDDSLATIYSDAAGTTEIVQNGTSNVSDSDGVVEFFVAGGDYYITVNSARSDFTVSIKQFNNVASMKSAGYMSKFQEGTEVSWACYRNIFDGGGNKGVVKFGAHTEDGGSIFSIDANTYIQSDFEGKAVNIRQFGAVCDGVADDSISVLSSISYAASNGLPKVNLTYGKIRITQSIEIPRDLTVSGMGYSTFSNKAATIILKDGDFVGVRVLDAAQLNDVSVEGVEGNGDDGVALLGGRAVLRNVSSFRHGRDGFKIGAYAGTPNNTNLWRAYNLISESNVRHGLYASDDNGDYNCNAGVVFGYDSSLNGGDGIRANLAADTQWYGVTCQVNEGWGFYAERARGNYLRSYLEQNVAGEAYYGVDSQQNKHEGSRSSIVNGGITDLGENNSIMDSSKDTGDYWLTPVNFYDGTTIGGGGSSGQWRIRKGSNRTLLIDLVGTTATSYWHLGSDGREQGLKISDGSVLRKMRNQGTSLSFGSIPANSTVDRSFTDIGLTNEYSLTVTPTFALPAGVIVTVYFNGTLAVARCANITGSPISVSGTFRLTALKIGA